MTELKSLTDLELDAVCGGILNATGGNGGSGGTAANGAVAGGDINGGDNSVNWSSATANGGRGGSAIVAIRLSLGSSRGR